MQQWTNICGHCEDRNNLVTPQNGVSVAYKVAENLQIEISLHRACAQAWSLQFNIPIPETTSRQETRYTQ
jgi:hypothetical protein